MHYARFVGVDLKPGSAFDADGWMGYVFSGEEAGQDREDSPAWHGVDDDKVEESVVGAGAGGNLHPTSVAARVGSGYLEHLLMDCAKISAEEDRGRPISGGVAPGFEEVASSSGKWYLATAHAMADFGVESKSGDRGE